MAKSRLLCRRKLLHSVHTATRAKTVGNSKAARHKRRYLVEGVVVSRRVKWRNESDRMAQDAMVDVRRSPSRIARDSNLIRISS